MADLDELDEPALAPVSVSGRRYRVVCRIAWDGIEYVGRLWFIEESSSGNSFADRSAIPGRTRDEVRSLAARLTERELAQRLVRAQAEKRRFHALRRATDDIIAKVRYMNQLAISARAGLLDADGAAGEVELTEKQLHEMVSRLRDHAGVEG
jgi:hypothetical protein